MFIYTLSDIIGGALALAMFIFIGVLYVVGKWEDR